MRILYSENGKTLSSDRLPDTFDALWADLGPEDREHLNEFLNQLYPAHPAAVNRVLNIEERKPGLLVEGDGVVFSLGEYELNGVGDGRFILTGAFVGKHFFVTTHWSQAPQSLEVAWDAVQKNHLLDEGADFALFQYLSRHINAHQEVVARLEKKSGQIHRMVLDRPYRNLASEILVLRREVSHIHRFYQPELEIFNLLASSDFSYVEKKNQAYFQDLAVQMNDIHDDLSTLQGGFTGTVQAFTSIQANVMNRVMYFLTIISLFALPPTTVASIYGMNFKDIPELTWSFGYWYALSLMAAIALVLFYILHRKRWLK